MSENGEGSKPFIEQGKISHKEEVKPQEIPGEPEKKVSPLGKASRAMRYVYDRYLSDKLPFRTKSAAANEYLIAEAKDEVPKPTTYKESVEAQERKDLKIEVAGNHGPLEILRGEESKVGRKVALLVLGGGQGGVFNAALLLEMQERGLLENADGLFGVSAGAGNIAFVAAGQGEDAVSMYWKENCEENKFVKLPKEPENKLKALKDAYLEGSDKPIIDTEYVKETIKKRGLDKNALKNNLKDIQVLAMEKDTAKSVFIDLKKADDPAEAVGAAICVPGISTKGSINVKIDGQGKEYVDGAFSRDPVPVEKIFDMGYTDVIVLTNGPFGESGQSRAVNVALAEIAKNGYGYNEHIVQLIRGHKRAAKIARDRVWDTIYQKDSNKRVTIIGLAEDSLKLNELETDSRKIENVYKKARELGGRIFNPKIPLGSKPVEQQSAANQLEAMQQ